MENQKDNTAVLHGKSLPISTKMSVEICNAIRGKPLARAKSILIDAIEMKRAIPIRRFTWNRCHHKGVGPGRYLPTASKMFLKLCESIEANAENKGLNVNNLVIVQAKANKAEARWHSGRKGRAKMKSTHIDLIVQEKVSEKREVKK